MVASCDFRFSKGRLLLAVLVTAVAVFTFVSDKGLFVRCNYTKEAPSEEKKRDVVVDSVVSPVVADGTPRRNETKLILLWSVHPENAAGTWFENAKEGSDQFKACEWRNCYISRDRRRVEEATVVVYKDNDDDPDWPDIRYPTQLYVHMLNDRPNPMQTWIEKYDGKINLTLNYRSDSDIPYHEMAAKRENAPQGKYVPRIPLRNKTKSVVWAVSHCRALSKRDDYAAELSKYIDVDIYGKCGTLECPRNQEEDCADDWERQYKFYLAFENSICRDYVSEKFFRTLKRELIPVVLGGCNYKAVSPPHSYIDVRDYKSPKDLAEYLRHLALHEDEYYDYFQWKPQYRFTLSISKSCKLCEIANNVDEWSRPAHEDYYLWWRNACYNELVDEMRAKGKW